MTLARVAYYFGLLELGFVLASAGVLSHRVFLVWSGSFCLVLMGPHLHDLISRRLAAKARSERRTTAPGSE